MGPYRIPNLTLLSSLVGKPAVIPPTDEGGTVQCVGLLKYYNPLIGSTRTWTKGADVSDTPAILSGTAIATFIDGVYPSHAHGNHACYFIRFLDDDSGFTVLEQHVRPHPNLIQTRDIKYGGNHPNDSVSNDGDAYSIIL